MFKLCVDAALISFSPIPGPRVSGSDLPSFQLDRKLNLSLNELELGRSGTAIISNIGAMRISNGTRMEGFDRRFLSARCLVNVLVSGHLFTT